MVSGCYVVLGWLYGLQRKENAMVKRGIPYFPLDVALDTGFELIEAEFGILGFGVIIKVLQLVYGEGGYYVEWTDEVALLFGKKNGLGGNVVSEIIKSAVRRGIFDEGIFRQFGVLTSHGIQERYVKACVRRRKVEIKREYLLLCNTEIPKNVYILGENVDISAKNADIFRQSKVKKSKEDNIVVVNSKVTDKREPNQDNNADQSKQSKAEYLRAVRLLESVKGAPLSGYEMERAVDFVKEYGVDLVCGAFKEMGDCNAFGMRYAQRILEDWRRHGRKKSGGGRSREQKPQGSIMTNETDYSDIYLP